VATAAKKPASTTATDTAKAKAATKPKAAVSAAPKVAPKAATKATPKAAAKVAVSAAPKTAVKVAASVAPKAAPKATSKAAAKAVAKALVGITCDADLLKMSEADYMNEAQMAYFKAKLEAMRDDILDNARETGEHLKENEVFADPNDRATVEEENMLEQRVRDRERKLLKKINASLARIEDGSYGYCLETGDPIGIPRLLARPTAELSIEAQEKHERLEKLYAD
jgi:DnaK suppressor protein